MNIEQANTIPISEILKTLGIKPVRETKTDAMYLSPIRTEKTASFHLNKEKNVWYDHGIEIGGDTVEFARHRLKYQKKDHTVSDALRWIKIMSGNAPRITPVVFELEKPEQTESNLILRSAEPLGHQGLFNYLGQRGIDLLVALNHLDKVSVYNSLTGKTITALGFKNENDGYELRNRIFKGCVGSKYITFIRGTTPKPSGIHIFEGFMDFLTVLTTNGVHTLNDDAIILNSVSCLDKATPYISDYGYNFAYTWMDNDKAGKHATKNLADFFKTQTDLVHKPMNKVYQNHKDVNAWHMHNLNLTL